MSNNENSFFHSGNILLEILTISGKTVRFAVALCHRLRIQSGNSGVWSGSLVAFARYAKSCKL